MDEQENQEVIKLDGGIGVGSKATLTIVTKDETYGEKEETFEFPYALIDMTTLNKFHQMNFILGYRIVKHLDTEQA